MSTNNEILRRVKLLMEYDLSMTLDENLVEQEKNKYNLEIPGYKTTPQDATSVVDPRTKQVPSVKKTDIGFSDDPIHVMDPHDQLMYASLGSYFIPVVGPFVSIGFDWLNGLLYLSEGDEFMFGLTIALSLVPGDDILKIVSKRYKVSRESVKSLIKKIIGKYVGRYTDEEIKILKEIGEASEEIIVLTRKYFQKLLWKTMFKTMSLKQILTYLYLWSKNRPVRYSILKTVFKFGSIYLTYKQLAKVFGIIEKEDIEEKLPSEQKVNEEYNENKQSVDDQIIREMLPYSPDSMSINSEIWLKALKEK